VFGWRQRRHRVKVMADEMKKPVNNFWRRNFARFGSGTILQAGARTQARQVARA
jgi:hypothetical protein